MSDTNERSVASTGSVADKPVAWAVVCGDCVDSMFTDRDKAVEWAGRIIPPAHIVPLYRVPTLTDAEREAINVAQNLMAGTAHARSLGSLLERLSPGRPEAIAAADTATPAEPAIPPAWLARPYWVDPAGGHRYGFPRLYDPATDGDMTAWLIASGYPESLAMQELACTFTACTEDAGK